MLEENGSHWKSFDFEWVDMTYVSKLENSICKSDAHSLAVACIHLGRVKAIKITWIWTSWKEMVEMDIRTVR